MKPQKLANWFLMILLAVGTTTNMRAGGVIVSLQASGNMLIFGGVNAIATGIAPNTGTFTVSRSGTLTTAVTVQLAVSGTAVPGVDYVPFPTNITLAANVVSSNLPVALATNATISAAKTVVLSIVTNSAYFLGLNTNAGVTLVPLSDATNSVYSPVGRYWRGSGNDPTYWSQVIPLDYEVGTIYSNLNGNAMALYGVTNIAQQTYYHYNATNPLPQSNFTNRIPYNNPIVAFGERVGGTPTYIGQQYNFGVYAGIPYAPTTVIISAMTNGWGGTSGGFAGETVITAPFLIYTNPFNLFLTNGFQVSGTNYDANGVVTTNNFGLNTVLSASAALTWGATVAAGYPAGAYVLSHTATAQATNYYYIIQIVGFATPTSVMSTYSTNVGGQTFLYTIEFEQRPPWRSVFLDQPHFDGSPLPPFYAGKSVAEMMTNTPPVTNVVNISPSAATNLDDSPELRRHPILDSFVASMGNDPIALANYVLNQIDLTDPMDYSDNGNVAEQSINPTGVTRGALGTFMEKQGSPIEQCALLVYLLRQAGVPAVYEFAPRNGVKVLDSRLSRMLKFQVQGAHSEAGQLYTTNTMIAVNYPWVAAYIGTNWVHIFPWLKDYDIVEGLNLWEEMPTNYANAYLWVHDYVYGTTNLLNLAVDGDTTPRVIFPSFLQQTLLQNHPGISVGDLGEDVYNRQHYYSRWQDFPTPTWVTNSSTTLESLTDTNLASVSPTLTNIFDTVSVEIYSQTNPVEDIQTGDLRLCDLHNREFYIYQFVTNSSVQLNLTLLPFRTNVTTQAAFTNDANSLSKEVLSLSLGASDDQLGVRFRYHRHRALNLSYAIDPPLAFLGYLGFDQLDIERPLRKGDQAAICLSYGRVTHDMLNVHAQDIWQMENTLRVNPALTNTISPDVYLGATIYLAGMTYYEKVGEFDLVNQHLNKIDTLSEWAAGLSKISPARNSSGSLLNGQINPILPSVDMYYSQLALVGNGTLRPDSGMPLLMAQQNYSLMWVTDASAEEHQAINRYYLQTNAVSTVRLLQLGRTKGLGFVPLNINNYVSQGSTLYQGNTLASYDASVWGETTNFLVTAGGAGIAYITPGPVTNAAYKGMAALELGWSTYSAIISPSSLNGGFGENFPSLTTMSQGNSDNFYLNDFNGYFSMTLNQPTSGASLVPSASANVDFLNIYQLILGGTYTLDSYNTLWSSTASSEYGAPQTGTANQNMANFYLLAQTLGEYSRLTEMGQTALARSSDPVNNITGEFYDDETDLQLPGPMPLAVIRHYTSQDLADNQFGVGWKLNLMPFLVVTTNGVNIYAADMDGSVTAYVQTSTNASVWLPNLATNPQLNNDASAGVGGLLNRLRNRIIQTVNGSTTNYTLYGADGSIRSFQVQSFNNGILNQTRPYLQQWTDNRGNYYTFTYGTNATQPNFGQVTRIQSSNGNFLGFDYDIYNHMIDAYTGDGRWMYYVYDEYGDLVSVTLPDNTTRSYQYQHATQAVTNGTAFYSTHLLIEADKPDGRALINAYDNQRRVTNQLSTAGADLNPILTATIIYSNNFNITNSFTNAISGYTLVIDGNGHTNRYDYTNNLITKVTDPLGQTIQQTWYADSATTPGYPRSVASLTDKRGLVSQFQYDANGNVTNTIIIGDLTGDGITSQTATNTAVYNSNSLPMQVTDPTGNSTVIVYDPTFTFLPQQVIRYAGASAVSTNFTIYGNATNVVVNGNRTQTNLAFGLPIRQIRAYGSPDAATNDLTYNGNGFLTQSARYPGTGDPNVTNTFFYNERGQMVDQVDALGAVTFFDYDPLNRPTEQDNFDEHGNALSWNFNYYTDNGEISWIDGPRFNPEDYIFYDYDGEGRRTTEIHWRSEANSAGTGVEAPAGYNLYAQSFYQYDPLGNLTLAVDPRGAMTTNTWDALSRLTQRQHLDTNGVTVLSTEGFGYEPGGEVKYYTNALGGVTTTLYTTVGKPEYRSNLDGSTNGWRYYLDGRIKREIQRNGAYWQTTYDDVNRITTHTFYSAAGVPEATNSTQLDRRGNAVVRMDEGGNVFTNILDGLDRAKITAGPAIVTISRYQNGNPPSGPYYYATNVLQHVVTNFYDAAGRVLTNVNALGETTVTTMDALGRTTGTRIYGSSGSLVREKYFAYSTDHNGVTVTDGSGTNAISHTTWTDNDGHMVLSIAYPATGANEFTLNRYDLAENLVSAQHDSAASGSVTTWITTSLAYDGLNRRTQKIDRDNAVTTYAYDPLNDLTNRVMPGGNLAWTASYNSAGQMLQERNLSGGSGTRTNGYVYFASGSPFAGLLLSKTDGRGVTCTSAYDDRLRVVTNAYSGSLPEQNLTTSLQYDPRSYVTNVTEQFASTNTGPATTVQRSFDPYGQMAFESVNVGSFGYWDNQGWDAAGRRTQLSIAGTAAYGFAWRADGSLVSASDPTGSGTYSYNTAGELTSRQVGNRLTTITSRDGEGRPLTISITVNLLSQLTETLVWSGDGLLASHTLNRSDFTDSRSYAYASLSRRLTQEQLNLNGSATWTNNFAYDGGVAAGPGALTSAGTGSTLWAGSTGTFARIGSETNNVMAYAAYGHVNGQATLAAWLDGQPVSITGLGTNAMQWRAGMDLSPGAHQLKVAAYHPSGFYTAWATNSFTNSLAYQAATDSYDNTGNLTNRVWKNQSGAVERTQTLTWDARGRLHSVTERDASNSGYNWTATYNGLNRRLSATTVLVTNGVVYAPQSSTINSYFDPLGEFLELGVSYGRTTEWKLYGPDLSGKYGGVNGIGGLDAVSPYLNLFTPLLSDFRGNILGVVTNGVLSWNPARPTAYGAVPGYRPVPLGNGASISLASAWRSKWADSTGYYQLGLRPYDPISGRWLTYDSVWNELDPNAYTFCGGDPVNGVDSDGRCSQNTPPSLYFGYAPIMEQGVQTTIDLKSGSIVMTGLPSQPPVLVDPNDVLLTTYNTVTRPTGDYGFFVSGSPLTGATGQTTITPYTPPDSQAELDRQFLAADATLLLTTLTGTEEAAPELLATDSGTARGVTFFSKDYADFYLRDNATLGGSGKVWFMPLEDSAGITSSSDAARLTGMPPSVQSAYTSGQPVYGMSFPLEGLDVSVPTSADAGGWPHFLEGGYTAVRTSDSEMGGYLLNPTREFVTPGGNPVPSGSVLFQINEQGAWEPIKQW